MRLTLLILLPLAGSLASALLRRRSADWAAMLAMSLTTLVALLAVVRLAMGEKLYVMAPGFWQRMPGSELALRLDGVGAIMVLVVSVVGLLISLYSTGYLSGQNREHPGTEGNERYHAFFLLFVAAMLGVALSPDFFKLFLFWELTTLCSWALIGHYRSRKALGAALKALAMTQFASLFFVAALLVLYVGTGSFGFAAVQALTPGARTAFVLLLLVAAWGKAAQFPFFTWLPSAMAAPTPASAFLHAAAMVKAGVFLMARLLLLVGPVAPGVAMVALVAALVTLYVGLASYFYQDDLKALLAYSTICNLALIFLGLALYALGAAPGLDAALLHLWNHAFTKSLLFLAVGAIAHGTGARSISALRGLAGRMPVAGSAFLVGALAISGLPPFGVFWSKLLLLSAALAVGGGWGWATVVLVLVESGFSLAWFLRTAHRILFGAPSPVVVEGQAPPAIMSAVLIALMVLTLAAPYLGMPLIRLVEGG